MKLAGMVLVLAGCSTSGGGAGGGDDVTDPEVFGRAWTFTVESATITATKSDGTAWDGDGSPPDPFVKVMLNGGLIATTPELEDTRTPSWDFATNPVVIQAGDSLSLAIFDGDVLSDDTIGTGCPITLDAAFVNAGGATCTGPQATIQITVDVL